MDITKFLMIGNCLASQIKNLIHGPNQMDLIILVYGKLLELFINCFYGLLCHHESTGQHPHLC